MKRTTIYLPDDIHMALRREALDQHVTMAELIRRMSSFYLESDRLFWQTVDRLRAPNDGCDPESVENAILSATRQVRAELRSVRHRR